MADYISQINLPNGSEYKISAERLKQTSLTGALNTFTNSTDLIYTAKGGGNGLGDKPTGVDAFGLLSFKTADGWYGQLLMSSNTASGLYWRTATSLSGGWNKLATISDIPTNLNQLTNGPGYTTNTGTVTKVSTGSGLTGGDITTTGTISHSNSVTAKTAYGSTATTASADGGTIKVTDIKYDACGHITASTDRTITLSQTKYNFSGTSFTSGKTDIGEHDANKIKANGVWSITSNGPASVSGLGAQSGDMSLYTQFWNTSWGTQIASDYRDGQLFVRGLNNGSWSNWLAIPMLETSTGGLGSASKPVYIDTNGKLQECTNSIPTNLNQLTNGPGYVTSSGVTKITIKSSGAITGGSNTAVTTEGTWTIGHSTSDGYKHVPATGTTSNGKFLKAGNSAGSFSWESIAVSDIPTASTSQAGVTTLSAAADDSSKAATAKSVYDLTQTVNGIVSAADALVFKGTITGKATTQNSGAGALTPAANCGDTYMVDTAGYVNGLPIEIGDLVICLTDSTPAATTSGNNKFDTANIRNKWVIIQTNVDSALFKGTNTFTDGHILIADGANGKVKDGGTTIANASVNYATSAGKATNDGNGNAITSTYVKLDGSNNMTGDLNIIAGDTDKFVNFWYNTNKTAGASWRIGELGSGSSDTNYFVIQSGTSTTSSTTWNNTVRIGANTYNVYLPSTTASTTTATGALTVGGGVGVAGRITASEINATRTMVVSAGKVYSNISGSNVQLPAKTSMLFANGIAFAHPALSPSNDVGWLRVLGSSESDTVFEIATGDDGGTATGEKIVVRQYNTSNAIAKEAVLLDKQTGETSFPVSITCPSFIGAVTGTADSWTNARKVYVNLSNASTDETINGGASNAAAIGIGVDGILGIGNGGTGVATLTEAREQFNGPEFIMGTWTAASGTWTGVTTDSTLYEGKQIILYMPFAGSGNATLELTLNNGAEVNGVVQTTGAKNVYFESTTRFTTHKGQNSQIHLIYHTGLKLSDGNTYEGWWYVANRDTNTNDVGYYISNNSGSRKMSNALCRYVILLSSADGDHVISCTTTNNNRETAKTTITTAAFDPFRDIYYYNTTTTRAAEYQLGGTNLWKQHYNIDLRYSFNTGATLTAHKDIYLVATLADDGTATLRNPGATGTNASAQATGSSAGPVSQILPTSDDGYIYIKLGIAQSTTNFVLTLDHPIYYYKNGALRCLTANAKTTERANITTTANAIAYYSDTTGTFAKLSSAKGALYATSTNGALSFGKLPVGEGGTGCDTLASGEALIGNGTSAVGTRAITNNTTATAVTASTNLITANTLYYHKGNSNIVTVGTITSGTWKGTAIAADYIGSHSTDKLTSGTLGTARGGLGNNSFTANRLLYTESATKISSTTSIYAGTDSISINATAAPANSGKFQVKGTSTMQHILPEADTTYDLGNHASLRWRTAYLTTSLCVSAKNVVNAYNTNGKGTFIGPAVMSICQTAAGDGLYLMGAAAQYGRMFINVIGTASAVGETWLYLGNATASGTAKNAKGAIRLYHTNATYGDYYAHGWWSSGGISDYTMIGATSTTKNTEAWTTVIFGNANATNTTNAHSRGNLRIYSESTTYTDIRSQGGYSKIFYLPKYNGNMYAIHAGDANAIGSGKKPVYIAANGRATVCGDTVGSAYQPVYSNAGELTASYPVQYSTWTINSGHIKSTLTASGIFTANTYVIALVVTSGESNLNGPLTWTSAADTLTITTTEATSGAVSGYVLTAIGTATGATNASSAS